jgi:hypothetical protein
MSAIAADFVLMQTVEVLCSHRPLVGDWLQYMTGVASHAFVCKYSLQGYEVLSSAKNKGSLWLWVLVGRLWATLVITVLMMTVLLSLMALPFLLLAIYDKF